MQLEKGCKPLKASQKMPRSRCVNLERRDHCSVIGKDHTSLLSTKMARDFKNKIMATEHVFSKISMDNVGNGQGGICNCIYLHINTCSMKHIYFWKEW
jgi:hypothetical protein